MRGSDYSIHLGDDELRIQGDVHAVGVGGYVTLSTSAHNFSIHADDLPALAVSLARAAKFALDLSRQEFNQAVRKAPSNVAEALNLGETTADFLEPLAYPKP